MKKVNKDDIVTIEDFAKEIGVSREMIEAWKEKGMPVIKLGNKYLRVWRPSALDWIVTFGQIFAHEEWEEIRCNKEKGLS